MLSQSFELSVAEGAPILHFKDEVPPEIFKSPRDGQKVNLVQRRGNRHGRYLAVVEYGSGGRRGFIVLLEGRDRSSWGSCASKLRKSGGFS